MIRMLRLNRDTGKLDSYLKKRKRSFRSVLPDVRKICEDVADNGDKALLKYIRRFDGWHIKRVSQLKVTRAELKESCKRVDSDFLKSLGEAKKNIESFHARQKSERKNWHEEKNGLIRGERYSAIESAGVYVPGGGAGYCSSVLMSIIPAKLAGVKKIIIATPASQNGTINPHVLAAANIAGCSSIYKIGGAHAIFAMAFSTKTVPGVDKIFGPGNIYVSAAKLLIQQECDTGIDMVAGPTEILIIADNKAKVDFIVSDLASQAEHGHDSMAILITTSDSLAGKVQRNLERYTDKLKNKGAVKRCLSRNGLILIVDNLDTASAIADKIAPEHLELQVARPMEYMGKISNAGAFFLGDYSPVSFGDYLAGTNHILPTGGRARFSSPLGVDDFMKRSSFLFSDLTELKRNRNYLASLSCSEGFQAHLEAIDVRLRRGK